MVVNKKQVSKKKFKLNKEVVYTVEDLINKFNKGKSDLKKRGSK